MKKFKEDKNETLLFSYFSGQHNNDIRLRRAELAISIQMDENTGGGRIQNDHNNSVESALIREENDAHLNKLLREKAFLDQLCLVADKGIVNVMRARYGARRGDWNAVALKCDVDRATAIRYRDKFKELLVLAKKL